VSDQPTVVIADDQALVRGGFRMILNSAGIQVVAEAADGQEAVAAGCAAAMKPGDLSFCTYRGHAHTLARGVPIEKVLGELMQGGQVSIEVGLLSAFIALIVGAAWGAVSGLAGGFVDSSMMRVVDILLSVPPLFIILIVADRYGATVIGLSVIIGGFTWLVPARLIRGEVLSLKTRDFVLAARSAGSGWWRLINRHLLPNALSVIVVNATFNVADAILFVSYLGILGFGLHYPILDWGDMISNGVSYMQDGYWWQIYPVGFCIVAFVMACNFVGDALRDALDVRLRRR